MATKLQQVYACSVCGNKVEVLQPSLGTLACCDRPMSFVEEETPDMTGETHIILGVHITDRVKHVPSVQHVFTEFGCNIKTRLGLHHVDQSFCSPNGLIIIEFVGDDSQNEAFVSKLSAIEGVHVRRMVFGHP